MGVFVCPQVRQTVPTNSREWPTGQTPFHGYGKHSPGPCTYRLWVGTYTSIAPARIFVLVYNHIALSNTTCTYSGHCQEFIASGHWIYEQSNMANACDQRCNAYETAMRVKQCIPLVLNFWSLWGRWLALEKSYMYLPNNLFENWTTERWYIGDYEFRQTLL